MSSSIRPPIATRRSDGGESALPFGLKLSPWNYQLFSEAMVLFLRRKGLLCHVYIDDALISAVLGRALADAVFAFVDLRTRLGFTISRKKSFLKGGSVLVHLGIILVSAP